MFVFFIITCKYLKLGTVYKKPNQLLQNFSQLPISFWAPEKGVYA